MHTHVYTQVHNDMQSAVRTHAQLYVRTFAKKRASKRTCMHALACASMHARTYVYAFIRVGMHTHSRWVHARTHVHAHACIYMYADLRRVIRIYVYTCLRMHIHTCIHAYKHTRIYAAMHTYMNIQPYACIHRSIQACTSMHTYACTHTFQTIHIYTHVRECIAAHRKSVPNSFSTLANQTLRLSAIAPAGPLRSFRDAPNCVKVLITCVLQRVLSQLNTNPACPH